MTLFFLVATAARAGEESVADRDALDAKKPLLAECYRGSVASAMGLNGNLTLRVSVSSKGLVIRVKLVKSQMGLPRYHDTCVVERVSELRLTEGSPRSFIHTFEWRRPDPFIEFPRAP